MYGGCHTCGRRRTYVWKGGGGHTIFLPEDIRLEEEDFSPGGWGERLLRWTKTIGGKRSTITVKVGIKHSHSITIVPSDSVGRRSSGNLSRRTFLGGSVQHTSFLEQWSGGGHRYLYSGREDIITLCGGRDCWSNDCWSRISCGGAGVQQYVSGLKNYRYRAF